MVHEKGTAHIFCTLNMKERTGKSSNDRNSRVIKSNRKTDEAYIIHSLREETGLKENIEVI